MISWLKSNSEIEYSFHYLDLEYKSNITFEQAKNANAVMFYWQTEKSIQDIQPVHSPNLEA